MTVSDKKYCVFVVPTGIGAAIGGFAGDAGLVASKIAREFPLIVNPNTVNAACFSAIDDNMLYVEGFSLTEFMKGNISLVPSQRNKIGVVFDKAITKDCLNVHINTINAVKTVYGYNIIDYEITKEPANVEFFMTSNGTSSGGVKNPETLLEAGQKLINKGADVLAVVCRFEEPEEDNYSKGNGVDVVGGVEAVISHYMTGHLNVPVVHSPAFDDFSVKSDIVHPKAAAEYITPTFLPCLFHGLNNAPLLKKGLHESFITKNNVKALIMPFNSLGSSIVYEAVKSDIPVIGVLSNVTVCNAADAYLGLKTGIIHAGDYKDVPDILRGL